MTDESYMTDIDLIIKEQEEKWGAVVKERTLELKRMDEALKSKELELKDKNAELKEKDAEIAKLRKLLQERK